MLKTEKLTFYYPKEITPALAGADLFLPEGGFTTLCGASGCGKSTLLRMLKPCLRPHGKMSGKIFFDGEPPDALSPRKAAEYIGYVSQNPEAQTVTDKVWHEAAFGLESIGFEGGEIRRRVAECAEYFGLSGIFERDTATLSGGEKQLLALTAAAALHPKLLLLDEPTAQLDPIAAQSFIDTIRRLNRDFGIAVLIAEHRLEELLPISDNVIVMDRGSIAADCEPRALAELLPADHPIRGALPAAARIYALSGARENPPPLTVREGRNSPAVRRFLKENPPPKKPTKAGGKPVLILKELWVSYGRRLPDALKCASLTLCEGEIYALLGGNGSGKTTLLKAAAGMIKPLGGKIKLNAKNPAYLPQNPCAILGQDSALGELTARRIPEKEAAEILSRFGISAGLLSRDPLDLSGGERQRLALAALMSGKPD
ncbi:MAG: ATP-binding cassette domain-containing protein, partial [Oscillospiraceae bacterium]|nr:ATP-binding cassette domain-containing protein [Oscillospiraceae bacterium]